MFESKYNKVLTIILIVVIIAIVGLLGFLGYDYFKKVKLTNEAADFVSNLQNEEGQGEEVKEENTDDVVNNPFEKLEEVDKKPGNAGANKTYQGFPVVGAIEIPKTNCKYPVLGELTKTSLEKAVVFIAGTGLNKPGNSVIIGHNYRNGAFFSNNKKLKNGDKIYIKDETGNKKTYTIYKKFETSPEDISFYQRDTAGKPEITLSTCTDNSKARLILFARAD